MKVSIIIPAYNTGELLAKSVSSVQKQGFDDWELIIVDDGSTDDTSEIADSYAKSDKRIKVIHTSNNGAYEARLTGVSMATGTWIMFIDSDDSITVDSIQGLLRSDDGNVDIICGTLNINNNRVFKHGIAGVLSNREYFIALLQYDTSIGPVAKLFRRTLFQDIPIPKIKITLNEDLLLLLALTRNSKKICVNPDLICYNYIFRNGTGRTGQMSHEQWQVFFDIIEQIARPIMNEKIRESMYRLRFERIDRIMIARGLFVSKNIAYVKEAVEYASAHKENRYMKKVTRLINSPLRQRIYFLRIEMSNRIKRIIKSIIFRK